MRYKEDEGRYIVLALEYLGDKIVKDEFTTKKVIYTINEENIKQIGEIKGTKKVILIIKDKNLIINDIK